MSQYHFAARASALVTQPSRLGRFVHDAPVEISAQQIEAFAKLYPHDVRALQPLNGRIVQETRSN